MTENPTDAGADGRIAPVAGWIAVCSVVLAGCLVSAPTPAAAETFTERYARLAFTAPEPPGRSRLWCATVPPDPFGVFGADPLRSAREPLPDGQPLHALQVPRFLRPTHNRSFGFNHFLVLGDHPAVTFERWDWNDTNRTVRWRRETWRRATTRAVAGRLVSVFHPKWPARLLRSALRYQSWGVDRPFLYWGRLSIPGTNDDTGVYLRIVPPNIPRSPVVRINDRVQYASHVVNVRDPDFGDSRVQGGDTDLNPSEITRLFYEHFADEYEVIAVVSEAQQLGDWGGFHGVIRNGIDGIGLDRFDWSARYGSAGVLQGFEGYPGTGNWATWAAVLHEQGHQYGEYTKAWESLRPPVDRRGHAPDAHTPLLFPDAVTYGAVLTGDRRVRRVRRAGGPDRFEIEPTLPLVRYHPLTLYRMGLVPAAAVPRLLVFRRQGQFDDETSSNPESGAVVAGARAALTVNDLMAADGIRRGPVARRIRRAIVYVSRGGLVPKAQMDILNYFARRLGTSSGVTSWNRHPSFREATGGRATMTTRIRPRRRQAARQGSGGRCAKVGTRALVGVTLDRQVGGCLRTGDTLRVSGRLTLNDGRDYSTVCLRFTRYPDAGKGDRILECARLDRGNRFALEATFRAGRPGGYRMAALAFWPGSGPQYPLSSYTGAIEVLRR